MASLIDLLQSGQLGETPLPDVLNQVLAAAAKQGGGAGPESVPLPGISVAQPPANIAPATPPQQGIAPPPGSGAVPTPASAVQASGPAARATPVFEPTWRQTLQNIGEALQGRPSTNVDTQNQTLRALVARGVDPETALAAVSNPELMKGAFAQAFAPKTQVLKEGERLFQTTGQVGQPFVDVTPGGGADLQGKTLMGRLSIATTLGMQPNSPEWKGYVLNGKVPDIPVDHQAVKAADEKVRQSKQLIDQIQQALNVSKGMTGGVLAYTAPIANALGGSENSRSIADFNNIVQTSILPGLKSIFPGRVTNVDVQLMKELAGSASQAEPVRRKILERTLARASELASQGSEDARQLREGTYYTTGGGAASAAKPTTAEETKTIGTKTYVKRNGTWFEQ